MLYKDEWLSKYFPQGAYRYIGPFDMHVFPKGFIFTKIPISDTNSLNKLLGEKFQVVEVFANFFQKKSLTFLEKDLKDCHFASLEDKDQILDISEASFVFSRFYSDPSIKNMTASKIKRDWVENYFHGKRGTQMIVVKKDAQISGFMLLIDKVIDLIAVSPRHLRRGVASKMIAFANKEIGLLSAGTQLANSPSILMYQNAGFFLKDSYYTLHKHEK
jgi:hypothetical protein